MSSPVTILSPDLTSLVTVISADMPEEKANARSAPSSSAICISRRSLVGLPLLV